MTRPNQLLAGCLCGRRKHLRRYLDNTASVYVQAEIPFDGIDFGLECCSDAPPDGLAVRLCVEYTLTISRADIFPDLSAGMRVIRQNSGCGLRLELANSSRMQSEPG